VPLPGSPTLSEVFCDTSRDGAGPAFVVAALSARARTDPAPDGETGEAFGEALGEASRTPHAGAGRAPRGPLLWIQDRLSLRESGRPYLAGMAVPGRPEALPEVLHLTVGRAVDVLWAMEQGLGCTALSAVVGEVWGDAPALDFTATKRLALRAEAHGVPAWMLRRGGSADLSAARMRWRLSSIPSDRRDDDPRAPGLPRWRAELFRARGLRPGTWTVRYDPAAHCLAFAAPPGEAGIAPADVSPDARVVPLRATA